MWPNAWTEAAQQKVEPKTMALGGREIGKTPTTYKMKSS